jgi:hypothetical protein
MANRDIIFSIIVLLGICWLVFENYQRPKEVVKPAGIERTITPVTPPASVPAAK